MYKISGEALITTGGAPTITTCSHTVETLGQARHVAKALVSFGVTDISVSVEKTVSLEPRTRKPKDEKTSKKK